MCVMSQCSSDVEALILLAALPQVFGFTLTSGTCSKMASPLLLVALTLCLPSLGSLQSRGPGSESSSESLEGSGRRADRTFWSGMIIPKRPNLSTDQH